MRTFRLEKLVHDGIVQGHVDEGGSVEYEVLTGDALIRALEAKLHEEATELAAAKTPEEKRKEAQDVANVEFALGRLAAPDFVPTKTFVKGHYIHTVTVPETSWLSAYYALDQVRYPEVLHD